MPLMNLNPAARQRHQVGVITVDFFCMLKSMQTYRVVKTKTEISALNDFISWLEERFRADEWSVLIYNEQRKFVSYMLIEALKKYNLLDRFAQKLKSFVNGFKLVEKCSKTIKFFSIRQLVLDKSEAKDDFEGNAAYQARLAYQIARRLPKKTPRNQPAASVLRKKPTQRRTTKPKARTQNNMILRHWIKSMRRKVRKSYPAGYSFPFTIYSTV